MHCASPEPPELCTDFLLHFKAVLLLLWLVTVVLLQEISCVAGQLAEGTAGEEGPFNYFWCPVVFSPFSEVVAQAWLKYSVNSCCFWMTECAKSCHLLLFP